MHGLNPGSNQALIYLHLLLVGCLVELHLGDTKLSLISLHLLTVCKSLSLNLHSQLANQEKNSLWVGGWVGKIQFVRHFPN